MLSLYQICAVTTLLSAFLLFQVQPLISKHILSWFGGGAMVWITALFFFMLVLLAGYVYVLVLSTLKDVWQRVVHGGLVFMTASLLIWHHLQWTSGITPPFSEAYFTTGSVMAILYILIVSIGAPFFILATTSSLVQLWYGKHTGAEPFSLYAISNIGSLAGLISYPFLFEPLFSTATQGMIWTTGFFIYSGALCVIATKTYTRVIPDAVIEEKPLEVQIPVTLRQFWLWTAVASIPVIVMLSGTSFISGFVAAMPFIWIAPLTLYLLSFVISFRSNKRGVSGMNRLWVIISSIFAITLLSVSNLITIPFILCAVWVNVFLIAHYCHDWLYEHRPQADQLPWFYVAMSLGGFLGSAGVLISTLFILKTPLEYLITVFGITALSLWQMYKNSTEIKTIKPVVLHTLAATAGLLLLAVVSQKLHEGSYAVETERNFFGTKRIFEQESAGVKIKTLAHEVTNHGYEYQTGPFVGKPTSYYTETSGVGRLLTHLKRDSNTNLRVASIGLGAGILSAYCRPNDQYTFFEIDPDVVSLTEKHFTFLEECDDKIIKIGDARQLLYGELKEGQEKYDVIIIDAYADDSVPAHLLTTEAMELYLSLLTESGVVAIHVSSRYLDLLPVVAGLAVDHNLYGKSLRDTEPAEYGKESLWTLVTRDPQTFEATDFAMMEDLSQVEAVQWTDAKNALLQVVKFTR